MPEIIINHTYQLKGGTQEAVEINNPLLARREPVVVFCDDGTTRIKIGDGVHHYNELEWVGDSKTKADKVKNAVEGNLAALDREGNLMDSGKNVSDFASESDIPIKQVTTKDDSGLNSTYNNQTKEISISIDDTIIFILDGEGAKRYYNNNLE